jgi:hypothetical protein
MQTILPQCDFTMMMIHLQTTVTNIHHHYSLHLPEVNYPALHLERTKTSQPWRTSSKAICTQLNAVLSVLSPSARNISPLHYVANTFSDMSVSRSGCALVAVITLAAQTVAWSFTSNKSQNPYSTFPRYGKLYVSSRPSDSTVSWSTYGPV